MNSMEQELDRIYAAERLEKRKARRQIGLFVAGAVLVGVALLAGLTFALGKGAVTTALVEQGLCADGDCTAASASFYANYENNTGINPVLLDWCVGTDELFDHTVGRRAWMMFPIIKLLQMPCGEV